MKAERIKRNFTKVIMFVSILLIILEVIKLVLNFIELGIVIPPNPIIICIGIPLTLFSIVYLKF